MWKQLFNPCFAILIVVKINDLLGRSTSSPSKIQDSRKSIVELAKSERSLLDPDPTRMLYDEAKGCGELHRCTLNITEDENLCRCDEDCQLLGTCCSNAPRHGVPQSAEVKCVEIHDEGVQMVVSCPRDYSDEVIRGKCELGKVNQSRSLPVKENWHVKSQVTNLSYFNIYCGICNGQAKTSLHRWKIYVQCVDSKVQESCFTMWDLSEAEFCARLIADCPIGYRNETLSRLCRTGDAAFVYSADRQIPYRNKYCLLCNEPSSFIYCDAPINDVDSTESSSVDMTLLVDPDGGVKCTEIEGKSETEISCDNPFLLSQTCEPGDFYNSTSESCHSICNESSKFTNEYCIELPSKISKDQVNCSMFLSEDDFVELYHQLDPSPHYFYHDSGISMSINGTGYCVACKLTSFRARKVSKRDNGTIKIEGKLYQKPFFFYYNETESIFVCDAGTYAEQSLCSKIGDIATVSVVLMSVSILFLSLMVLLYCTLTMLKNTPGRMVLCQVLAHLLAYIFFLSRVGAGDQPMTCHTLMFFTQYFFLAAYFWTFLFALEVLWTVSDTYTLSQRSRKKLIRYYIIGWTVPLLSPIITQITEYSDLKNDYKPQIGGPQCWFQTAFGLKIYFLVPIAMIFCANLLIYITLVLKLACLAYQTRKVKTYHVEKLVLSIKLFFAFGLLWLIGLLAAIFEGSVTLKCSFLVVNGLNGVLLFLVFICTKAVFTKVFRRNSAKSTSVRSKTTQNSSV